MTMSPIRNVDLLKVALLFAALFAALLTLHTALLSGRLHAGPAGPAQLGAATSSVRVVTWNVAAINNNPFEYWITHDEDPSYDSMMQAVRLFVEEDPGGVHDVPVHEVFTTDMLEELMASMAAVPSLRGIDDAALQVTRTRWETDLKDRRIVSGFLKDKSLGSKRLVSMPDRISNTIRTAEGGSVHRPTVINCYRAQQLASVADWWQHWQAFMFRDTIAVPPKARGSEKADSQKLQRVVPATLLKRISRAKYPALTAEEEDASLPLQTLALAIFDAIMVHMMSEVAATSWQSLRKELCTALNAHKPQRTVEILGEYASVSGEVDFEASVVCLQETSAHFLGLLRNPEPSASWLREYGVLSPAGAGGGGRDQNSLILLRRDEWEVDDALDVTSQVESAARVDESTVLPWSSGDLLAVLARRRGVEHTGDRYLVASFHGDTNGLATVPMIQAVLKARDTPSFLPAPRVLIGLDANAYEHPKDDGWLGVRELEHELIKSGLSSNWQLAAGGNPIGKRLYYTTFNARTFLQPQLNKAVRRDERGTKGDHNPKDFVLFDEAVLAASSSMRDNTGGGPGSTYEEDIVFPTLQFPSDHALVATTLVERQ